MTSEKTRLQEQRVRWMFREEYPTVKPLEGPVAVLVEFYMDRKGKPDLDNLVKLVLDALNRLAYKDDAQIMSVTARKYYPDDLVPGKKGLKKRRSGDPYLYQGTPFDPHTFIHVEALEEEET